MEGEKGDSKSSRVDPSRQAPKNELQAPKRHSIFGIVSLVIGIIFGGILFLSVMGAGFASLGSGGNESDPIFVIIGLFICGGMTFNVLGIILGIVGLAQKNKYNLFPILGTAVNSLSILALIALLILGSSV